MTHEIRNGLVPLVARFHVLLVVVVLLGASVAVFISPTPEVNTQITDFLPDETLVKDHRLAEEVFGPSGTYHNILIRSTDNALSHSGVLSPSSLRDTCRVEGAARGVDGVVQTLSVAGLVDMLCMARYDLNLTRLQDEKVIGVVNHTCMMVGKDYRESWFNNWTALVQDPQHVSLARTLTLEQFRSAVTLLLSDDFDPANRSAMDALVIVMIDPTLSITRQKEVSRKVVEVVNGVDVSVVEVHQTGLRVITNDVDRAAASSFPLLAGVVFLVIVLLLAVGLREPVAVVSALLTLLISLVLTGAFMSLVGFSFTLMDVIVVPLVMGLGIDYTVHLTRRRMEAGKEGRSPRSATSYALFRMMGPMSVALITTLVAFLSSTISNIRPLVEFGITCSVGISISFLLSITFMMAFQTLGHRVRGALFSRPEADSVRPGRGRASPGVYGSNGPGGRPGGSRTSHTKRVRPRWTAGSLLEDVAGPLLVRPYIAIAIVAMLTLGGSFLAVRVHSNFDMKEFLPADWDSVSSYETLDREFNGSGLYQSYILIRSDHDLLIPSFILRLGSLEDSLAGRSSVVTMEDRPRTVSLLSVIRSAITMDPSLGERFRMDPITGTPLPNCTSYQVRGLVQLLYRNDTTGDWLTNMTLGEMISSVLEVNGDSTAYRALVRVYVDVTDSRSTRRMKDELDLAVRESDLADTPGLKVSVTGHAIVTLETMDVLMKAMVSSAFISIAIAMFVLLATTRSFTTSLVAVSSVGIGVIFILATMVLFHVPVTVLTVMVASLTVGLGIDHSVYVADRYREEMAGSSGTAPVPGKKNTPGRRAHRHTVVFSGGGAVRGRRSATSAISNAPDTGIADPAVSRPVMAARAALSSTGASVLISALTTIAGFGVLVLSPIPIIRTFGLISAITIAYSFILAVSYVPAVLVSRDLIAARLHGMWKRGP